MKTFPLTLKQVQTTVLILLYSLFGMAQGTVISNFGSNPGNLNAYSYVPATMPSNAPLVVVIHGCTQSAPAFATETAWNTLADAHKFYVVYAEQNVANNANNCFNFWTVSDISRNQGEALSVKQMTDYMKSTYSIDSNRVFAAGFSAGGAFTAVMLSTYPEVFAAGAEMAGFPYKIATSAATLGLASGGNISKTPQQWGALVRAENPNYTGKYPRLAIFHGTADATVNKNNATEMMKQFTNLHNTDQTADYTSSSFIGNSLVEKKEYLDADNRVAVETFMITNMAHGIAVDPGICYQQGGTIANYSIDVNFYSSFWAAQFFDILQLPYSVSGLSQVNTSQQGVTYSVPNTVGSSYTWTVPTGATIVSGQGTNSITVNWGSTSGSVSVTETLVSACTAGPVELFVSTGTTGLGNIEEVQEELVVNTSNGMPGYFLKSSTEKSFSICVYDISGRVVYRKNDLNTNEHYNFNQKLSPGMYIMNCVTAKNKLVQKVVVE